MTYSTTENALEGQSPPPSEARSRVVVGREEDIYRPDAGEDDPHFFRDLGRWAAHRDIRAHERLNRYARSQGERRDIGSGAFGGFVVPQFLVDSAAGVVRNGDSLLAVLRQVPLPSAGMTFTVPRSVTTAGAVAFAQTSENTAVAEADYSMTNIERSLVTIAGQVGVTFQAMDRSPSLSGSYIVNDLNEAVTDKIDDQLINGSGTNGQLLGLRNVANISTITWNGTNPTRNEFTRYTARAAASSNNARLKVPDTVVMHGRRWHWLLGANAASDDIDSIAHTWMHDEYIEEDVPFVGTLAQLNVVADNNIPTTVSNAQSNEDVVIVFRRRDTPIHLGPLNVIVNPQTEAGSLEVGLVAYRYAVWFPDRYRGSGTAVLTGTGLATPVF